MRPSKVVNSFMPVSGSAYGASVPLTRSPCTRTKLMVRISGAAGAGGVWPGCCGSFHALIGRFHPTGIITTSPYAESPRARSEERRVGEERSDEVGLGEG